MEILRTCINAPGHRSAGVKSREVEKKSLQGGSNLYSTGVPKAFNSSINSAFETFTLEKME